MDKNETNKSSGSTLETAVDPFLSHSFLDITQDPNTGKPAGWRWIDDCLVRFQQFDHKWVEDDLWIPVDRIDTFDKLVWWMEHVGKKSRCSKRELISMVKRWQERFSR